MDLINWWTDRSLDDYQRKPTSGICFGLTNEHYCPLDLAFLIRVNWDRREKRLTID